MNISERLKEAYENVSFSADSTWAQCRSDPYHKSNLELYLTERHVRKLKTNRPRSVRECIPHSRLATYGDYEYNESREMSYAAESSTIHAPSSSYHPLNLVSEPWENSEVDGLFCWYTSDHQNFASKDTNYESPLLNAYGFEDRIMKVHLNENLVKEIWRNDNDTSHDISAHLANSQNNNWENTLDIYMSPLRRFFVTKSENCDENNVKTEWFQSISVTKDLQQLEDLSNFFRDENDTIAKLIEKQKVVVVDQNFSATTLPPESTNTEILYSEVLQGLLPSKKLFKNTESSKNAHYIPGKICNPNDYHQENNAREIIVNSEESKSKHFPVITINNDKKPAEPELSAPMKPLQSNIDPVITPPSTYIPSTKLSSTNYGCNKGNADDCNFARWKFGTLSQRHQHQVVHPIDMMHHPHNQHQRPNNNDRSAAAFIQQSSVNAAYVHQNYFHSPLVPTFQRWISPNFVQTAASSITASNNHQWYCQPNQSDNTGALLNNYGFYSGTANSTGGLDQNLSAVNNLRRALEITEFKGFYTPSNVNSKYEREMVMTEHKSDDSLVFEEHPVSASISEELETQALEQYESSNENFYQDLERQATEQYRSNPE